MTPNEIAAVKAEHVSEHYERSLDGSMNFVEGDWCQTCAGFPAWPCLPYRLAVEVERLAGKVARVEVLPHYQVDSWFPDSDAISGTELAAALADPQEVNP